VKLYLVRHGEAVPEEENPERPLSRRGRAESQNMALFLGVAGIRVPRIVHSGKKRAAETADILGSSILGPECEARDGLGPKDPVGPIAEEITAWTEDVMIVGHLPFLERLASQLLTGDEKRLGLDFSTGAVVCLERGDAGTWSLGWMVRPDLLASTDLVA
jgi:phosphohistidine phosphatase